MQSMTRRRFLQTSLATGAALAWPGGNVLGANDDIRLGFIGIGGRGGSSIKWFRKVEGCRIVALCDVDEQFLAKKVEHCKENGETVRAYQDPRKMMEDKDIDAVVISTCNHTHALLTIWCCQTGKDVYVEKPVCGTIWEGIQMAAARQQNGRIVQGGFQNRSDVGLREFFPWAAEGNLGKLKAVRGLCYRNRTGIGKRETPLEIPEHINYDAWLGPAKDEPIYRPRLHYDWHWDFNTGNGDIGNQGPHEMDLCRWTLGDPDLLPTQVASFGGRFGWDDAGNTPNLQLACFQAGDVPVYFEVCDLRLSPTLNASPHCKGTRVGIIATYEGGEFRGGRGGGWVYDEKGEKVKQFAGEGGGQHAENFIQAVRSRKQEDLHSPVEQAYLSSSMSHLANISYRVGEGADMEELEAAKAKDEIAMDFLERFQELLGNWNVDFKETPWSVGPGLAFDPRAMRFTGDLAPNANKLVHRNDREGYEIPKLA